MSEIFAIVRFGDYSEYQSAIEAVEISVLDENGSNLLEPAIAYNRPEIVQDLLARGINLNHIGERGMSPLQLAIQWRQSQLAEQLINLGADLNSRDIYGNNALWYATIQPKKDYDLVTLLVQKGSDSHAKNNAGRSPIDFAIQTLDEKLVQILNG